ELPPGLLIRHQRISYTYRQIHPVIVIACPAREPEKFIIVVMSPCDVPVFAIMRSDDLHARAVGRHDWQQEKRCTFRAGMQGRLASKKLCRPIITIIVQPWYVAARAKYRVAIPARALEVLPGNVHCDPEASRQHDAHWPDFNVKFIDLI